MIDLSIVIVNYKSPRLVIDCIRSIYAGTKNISYEVIVVDNDSADNSEELIMRSFSDVQWVQMGYNSGFARANNKAIRLSGAPIVLLLNSDTLITGTALELCYNNFKSSDWVACGVQLLNGDGSPQISGNYFMTGGLNYLLPLPIIGSLAKAIGVLFQVQKPNILCTNKLVEVDWINGAFLMVKKSAIEKAGLMDEEFFLYAEEAEWCSRLKKVGKLCIFGQYNVIHYQGSTANEEFQSSGAGYFNLYDRKGLQIMVSNFVRIRKQFGVFWFLLLIFFYILEIPFLFLLSLLAPLFGFSGRFSLKKFVGYVSNVYKLLKLSPKIIDRKQFFYKIL